MTLALTHTWAEVIIDELTRQGVQHICIAPGSRSTPLTLAAVKQSQHPRRGVTLHSHFDERGLGYLALGLAKAHACPVAVVVTSGTAVANLLPAVAESRLTGEPLVILSADRPFELVDCGANQAIEQSRLFSSHVTQTLSLPAPETAMPLSALLSKIDHLMAQQAQHGGSVHINCPFREPFYGERDRTSEQSLRAGLGQWLTDDKPYVSMMPTRTQWQMPASWQHLASQSSKVVLIAGALPANVGAQVARLASVLDAVVLADPQSGVKSTAPGHDLWLNAPSARALLDEAEWVIQLGGRLVSKRLGQWLANIEVPYWLITDREQALDPAHRPSEYIRFMPQQWEEGLDALSDALTQLQRPVSGWAQAVTTAAQIQRQHAYAKVEDSLSEHRLFQSLPKWLPSECDVFLGNSLTIRLADIWSELSDYRVYANRGASGIDGLLASAAGVQRVNQHPMLVVLGDTSALYDLNSLALWGHAPAPAVILILNNDGGGIFDMLPVEPSLRDAYYRMPHGLGFEPAATMFGLPYHQPKDVVSLNETLQGALQSPGAEVIEVNTPAGEAGSVLNRLLAEVAHG